MQTVVSETCLIAFDFQCVELAYTLQTEDRGVYQCFFPFLTAYTDEAK